MIDLDATVVAIATPPGRGGVGCVRLSGPAAVEIANGLFRADRGAPAAGERGPVFGRFLGRDGRALDHGYLVLFTAERSFTREPTAELWPHGSPAVMAELVAAATARGARPAGPGEFTYRALRHGRLDLSRAEAVRDLVSARTVFQARTAFAQVEGGVSQRVAPLREALLGLLALAEAAVEFEDEAETHLDDGAMAAGIRAAAEACAGLLAGFRRGRLVREGATVVLTGRPNVGKSSLFNRLLERDRAIVTPVPGTTRDTLEETLDLDGVPVRVVDTAGLRKGRDPIEEEGIRRARQARDEADLIVLVLDASRSVDDEEIAALAAVKEGGPHPVWLVAENKADLLADRASAPRRLGAVRVSAKTGDGVAELRVALRELLLGSGPLESPVLTDVRHAAALEDASAALRRAGEALEAGFTEEIVLVELRDAADAVGGITGAFGTEELFERIFTTFCIGK